MLVGAILRLTQHVWLNRSCEAGRQHNSGLLTCPTRRSRLRLLHQGLWRDRRRRTRRAHRKRGELRGVRGRTLGGVTKPLAGRPVLTLGRNASRPLLVSGPPFPGPRRALRGGSQGLGLYVDAPPPLLPEEGLLGLGKDLEISVAVAAGPGGRVRVHGLFPPVGTRQDRSRHGAGGEHRGKNHQVAERRGRVVVGRAR